MVKKFVDEKILYIENDIEKIRTKPGMYISYLGEKGALHLVKETVNNAIDECVNPKSPGKTVKILFHDYLNMVTISDDGRGLPIDMAEIVCTKIQSGSKFTRDAEVIDVYKKSFSAGENGVGMTATTALASKLYLTIYWNGQYGEFHFEEGKLVKKIVKASDDPNKHGTTIAFIPSEQILGRCNMKFKDIEEWVNNTSYLIDPKITIILNRISHKKEYLPSIHNHPNGIVDLLTDKCGKKLFTKPVYVGFEGYYLLDGDKVITYNAKSISKKDIKGEPFKVYVAFGYAENGMEDNEDGCMTFCDYIHTVDNGVHANAAKLAWSQAVSKLTQEAMTENELKKYPITFDDTRVNLVFTMNLFCDKPQFASQTKEKISNDELFKPLRQVIYNGLIEQLRSNPKELKIITNWVKTCAKSRLEVNKIRKSEYRPMDSLAENTLSCFNPAYSNKYKELYIVEGDSAKGSLVTCRDARTQALFAVKGVPLNVFDCSLSKILQNEEFKYLIKILGCGIGKDFNIDKLKYDKVIIFTDSDIDGFRIASLLSVFFITQMPQLIENGKLFKAVAPLYIVDDKHHPYLLNKTEYYQLYADKITQNIELFNDKKSKIEKKEFKNLILKNTEYLNELRYLMKYFHVHPDIIEFTVRFYQDKDFGKKLTKRFSEMSCENNVVFGVYNDNYQYLIIDDIFINMSKRLREIIFDTNNGNIFYNFSDNSYKNNNGTLGQLFLYSEKYLPKIKSRIKGLGELPADILWETVLNPSKRELTMLSIEKMSIDLERFKILHGKNIADQRRALMDHYILDKEDIDN